jgi:hypothetical protein
MIERFALLACLCFALAPSNGAALAQTRDPPTIITPPKPLPAPSPPAANEKRDEPRSDFCCTPYGRFGPVGNPSGKPGIACQWTLPSSVTQGFTCG